MFEKILSQIKEPALEIIQLQANIPADKQGVVADDAIAAIGKELDRILDSGDFSALSDIKKSENPGEHPTFQNIIHDFSQRLQQNVGLDNNTAMAIGLQVIPQLFNTMKEKFSGIDPKSLMSSLSLTDIMKLMANMGKIKEAFKN